MAGAVAAVKSASIGTILSATGSVVSGIGSIAAGNAQKSAADFQAKQLEQRGQTEEAVAQRRAEEERRQTRLMQSRAMAVGAASGGGIDLDLAGDIEEDGEYRALTALWEGVEARKGRDAQAGAARLEGRQRQRAGLFKAGSSILSGGTSLFEKYG